MECFTKSMTSLIICVIIGVTMFSYGSCDPISKSVPDPHERNDQGSGYLREKRQVKEESGYRCPEGWVLNSNSSKCFRIFQTTQTWAESLSFCREFGGDLVSIHSESDFVLAKSLTSADTWIGLNDVETEGVFVWSDSSPVDFVRWGSGEPSNGNENCCQNCGQMRLLTDLTFDDDYCTLKKKFICQKIVDQQPDEYNCPEGWILNPDSSKCFRSVHTHRSWPESLNFCRDFNGDLASIHSENEFVFAKSMVSEDTWIGLNDIQTGGRMEWSDSSAVDFTSWAPGQPNNTDGTENCVDLNEAASFDFADDVCSVKKRFLCQKIKDEQPPEYSCPQGWNLNSDSTKCLRAINTQQTWAESLSFCREFEGDLASLHSETEFTLAKSLIAQDTWIGLNEIETQGLFQWSDSSAVDFTSWAFGEPNNNGSTENCVDLNKAADYDFTESSCTELKRFLCEKTVVAADVYDCPQGWILNTDSSKCFRSINDNQTWAEGLSFCRDFGGDLVSLHSETDFVLAKSLINQDTWTGLNDIAVEGVMEWSDSSAVDFTSWYPGEPNNLQGEENCVELRQGENFDFNDIVCTKLERFMCQKIVGGVSTVTEEMEV